MKKLLTIGIAGLLASLVGCGGTTLIPPRQEQPCGDGGAPGIVLHKNRQNLCVECTSNAECKDLYQCNLITGSCELAPVTTFDAGPGGSCTAGAVRCAPDLSAVQDCKAVPGSGTGWVSRDPGCPAAFKCNPNTKTCATCSRGERVCNPENGPDYQRCNDDGTGYDTVPCSTTQQGFQCKTRVPHQNLDGGGFIAGDISCQLCVPNSSQCGSIEDGGVGILNCDSTGALQTFHSCYPTNTCDTQSGAPKCGTAVCFPGQNRCADASNNPTAPDKDVFRQSCNNDGTAYVQADCTAGLVCGTTATDQGACKSPCDVVANSSSYTGCDFWGALTSNNLDPIFTGNSANGSLGTTDSEYAFVVSNTSDSLTAHVTVSMDGVTSRNATVAPLSVQSVHLPWRPICGTGLNKTGAHLVSDVPVTVYQFNPLASAKSNGRSCSNNSQCNFNSGETCTGGHCTVYAFTADASLLLPTHLLGLDYVVVASDQIGEKAPLTAETPLAGMMAIVATQDQTFVQIRFAGDVASGASTLQDACNVPSSNLPAKSKGPTLVNYSLSAGQVVQFLSASTGTPDLRQQPPRRGRPGVPVPQRPHRDDREERRGAVGTAGQAHRGLRRRGLHLQAVQRGGVRPHRGGDVPLLHLG